MKRTILLILILMCAGVAHSQTWTYTQTSTPVPALTPTPTYTPTTYLLTANVDEFTVVDSAPSGVTVVALPISWLTGHYRVSVLPVNYVPTSAAGSYLFQYIEQGVTATGMTGGVEIVVTNGRGGKVPLTNNPVTFSFSAWKKNND